MIYTCAIDTPLGSVRAAAAEDALTGLWFSGQKYYPQKTESWITQDDYPVFAALRTWLDRYFAGKKPVAAVPLAPHGTAFQQSVWEILKDIPYGETTTYGGIAEKIAARKKTPSMSAQAVGSAVGHNPISLLIPCHRVLGADGSLTGYAGGLDRKRRLLQLEQGPV